MVFLLRFRWIFAVAITSLAIAGWSFLDKALTPNNELSIWFVKNDPTLKQYQEFNTRYGNDRLVILLIHDSSGVWRSDKLRQIQTLTQELQHIEGVKSIRSIINSKDLFRIKQNDTIRIKFAAYFDGINLDDPQALQTVRQQLDDSPNFKARFINHQWTSSILLIQLEAFEKVDNIRGEIIDNIERQAAETLTFGAFYLGGLDFITYGLNKLSSHDFRLFMTITYVIIFVLIYLYFRRWQYVLLSFCTVTVSVLITLSMYGFFDHQLNLFSLVIPTLIAILGLINILHIINEFEIYSRLHRQGKSQKMIIAESLQHVFRPCLFTTITTMIGFLSLLSSSTAILREFGLFAAIGILIALVCSFVFSAIALLHVRPKNTVVRASDRIAAMLAALSMDIQSKAKAYWIGIAVIFILSVLGIIRMKADMFIMGYFPDSSEIVRNHNFITVQWGNYIPIDLLAKAENGSNFKNAGMITMLQGFQAEVTKMPEINSSFSMVNVLDRASVVILNRDLEKLLSSPTQTHRLLQSLLRRSEFDISAYISDDFQTARLTFTGPLVSIAQLEKKIDYILSIGEQHFGDRATLRVTSYPALFLKITNYAVDSMVKSLGLAIVLILFTLTILLKSIRMAILAMIPNLFPIFLMFSFMGAAGINLDLATATVASIAIGVAVDDTIHLLAHYQRLSSRLRCSVSQALKMTYDHVGRIIVISSIVLSIGYSVLLLASIKTAIYFGLLIIVAIVGALIGDLVILPLLLGSSKDVDIK